MIRELLCPFVEHGQLRNVSGQCFRQGTGEPPLPVGALGAGSVDAGLTAQMQPVRQRDHSGIRYTGKAGTDHGLGQLFRLAAQVAAGIGHILGTGVGTPAFGGHIVVGAGVHHAVAWRG